MILTPVIAASLAVYIGTSPAKPEDGGIYLCRLDTATGALSEPKRVASIRRPSFLAAHPTGPFIYSCDETSDAAGKKSGAVAGFQVNADTGGLTPINQQMSAGLGPCFVEVDPSGRTLLVANYGSGSVASLPIDPTTGKLAPAASAEQHQGSGPNAKRQTGPHAHSIRVDPTGHFALSADLGIDKVMLYRLGADSTLAANDPPFVSLAPGAGPRHLAFSRDGKFAYVGTELGNTVAVFSWNGQTGAMREVQTISTLPEGFAGESYVAEVALGADGRFLYVSNRGHDSIGIFEIAPATSKLTPRGYAPTLGKFPRHFAIDPSGTFMIVGNQNSNDLNVFKIDASTGALAPTGAKATVPAPTCVRFWR